MILSLNKNKNNIYPLNHYRAYTEDGLSDCKSLIKGPFCKPRQLCPGGTRCPKNGICLPDPSIEYECKPKKKR